MEERLYFYEERWRDAICLIYMVELRLISVIGGERR
jgi:hypothetical protein